MVAALDLRGAACVRRPHSGAICLLFFPGRGAGFASIGDVTQPARMMEDEVCGVKKTRGKPMPLRQRTKSAAAKIVICRNQLRYNDGYCFAIFDHDRAAI